MSATCDPLVRGQTSAGQSPARICVAYNIALGTIVRRERVHSHGGYRPAEISRRFDLRAPKESSKFFKAVDNSRTPRPMLHTAAQS